MQKWRLICPPCYVYVYESALIINIFPRRQPVGQGQGHGGSCPLPPPAFLAPLMAPIHVLPVRLSVCPFVPYGLLTRKRKDFTETKIGANIIRPRVKCVPVLAQNVIGQGHRSPNTSQKTMHISPSNIRDWREFHNPSEKDQYSIYLPRRDGRLS